MVTIKQGHRLFGEEQSRKYKIEKSNNYSEELNSKGYQITSR